MPEEGMRDRVVTIRWNLAGQLGWLDEFEHDTELSDEVRAHFSAAQVKICEAIQSLNGILGQPGAMPWTTAPPQQKEQDNVSKR